MDESEFILRSSKRKQEILELLFKEKYLFLSNIARKIGISIVTTRQHLEEMYNLDWVEKRASGKFVFYSVTKKGVDLLKNIHLN